MLDGAGSWLDTIIHYINPLFTFIVGMAVAFWKVAGVFNRVALLEQKHDQLTGEVKEVKQDLLRTEKNIIFQLDRLNDKLDRVLLKDDE